MGLPLSRWDTDSVRVNTAKRPPCTFSERRNWLITTALDLAIVLAVACFICFYDLNSPSINYRDETTHISAIQSMRDSGEWWKPVVRGQAYFNKPPFKMWLTFLPLAVFGESAFSYRFWDALCGVMTCTLLYFFGCRVFSSRLGGIVAALGLIGSEAYVFGHGVRKAVQDSMLLFLGTLALVLGWQLIERLCAPRELNLRPRVLATVCGACVGLAVLTKSVAGFIPLAIGGLYLALSGNLSTLWRRNKLEMFLVAAPAVLLPAAYIVPHCLFTPEACGTIFGEEVFTRSTRGYHNRNEWASYFTRLFIDRQAIPPALIILSLCFGMFTFLRTRNALWGFLLVWAVFPLVLFTPIPSRLTWYISLSFPAMALLTGGTLSATWNTLRLPLAHWWAGHQSLGSRNRLLLCFLGFAAFSLYSNLENVIRKILSHKPRHQFDLIVSDIVAADRANPGSVQIFRHNAPEFALHESTYGGMIKRFSETVTSVDDLTSKLAHGSTPLVLSNLSDVDTIHRIRPFMAYKVFSPFYDRNRWMALLSYRQDRFSPHLTDSTQVVDFGTPVVVSNYGLGARDLRGSTSLQYMSRPNFSIPLHGDSLRRALGTEITLSFGSIVADPVRVTFFLNARELFSLQTGRRDIRPTSFFAPPGIWENGTNALNVDVENADGSPLPEHTKPLLLDWLSIKLGRIKNNNSTSSDSIREKDR